MRSGFLFCRVTGQPKDVCFCESCLLEDAANASIPAEQYAGQDWTGNYDITVQYVRDNIKLITESVRKANRTPMATAKETKKPQNGIQRLELKDLTSDKKRLKILWAGDPAEVGVNADWATVSVKFQSTATNTKRVYTMGDTNPCLHALQEGFGESPDRWVGKEIFAWKTSEGVLEKEYMRFACIDEKGNEIPFDYSSNSSGNSYSGGL